MTLNLNMPGHEELKPRIIVFGVGGAGGNAVNNMIEAQLEGVDFVVANTDAQALQQARASAKIQMGVKATEGLGAGARASVGAAAAEETIEEIVDHLAGAHMCFITAGMGGGTGTGAAPIIAQAARELGILTVGVVTKPFQFEGTKRMKQAEDGIDALQKMVDTLIIIPNQNLFRLANERTTFTEAFAMADDVLYQGVKGVTDLMVKPGLINLDFADVRAVMDEMGKAMMGTGEAEGEERAVQASEKAIANPLLDEISLKGARGVLINITGGYDLTLFELDEAANRIREEVDPEANIIVGSTLDPNMEGFMRVSVVATGIDAVDVNSEVPVPRRRMAEPLKPATRAAADAGAEHPAAATHRTRVPEPMVAETPSIPDEPELFDATRAAADEQLENVFPAETAGQDDVPPPAYQGRPESEPGGERVAQFVSPRASGPGAPTNEALARLQAAVQRQPGARVREEQPATPKGEADRPRFGINSLINRMTGHGGHDHGAQVEPVERAQPPMRARIEARVEDEPEIDMEIPAFLRRQAN